MRETSHKSRPVKKVGEFARRLVQSLVLTYVSVHALPAQSYHISTIAGGGLPVEIPGTSAFLPNVGPVAVDSRGNVFLATSHAVLRLESGTGILSLVAGDGTAGFSGDNGPASSAQLRGPGGIAVDPEGNVYIADSGNNRIRKVSGGVITTVAGDGTPGFGGDKGAALRAQLCNPRSIALDIGGNLYVADRFNLRVRKVSAGIITTVAGNGSEGFSGDGGDATRAQLSYPNGVAVDTAGNLYIAEAGNAGNARIRKVSRGIISTVAGIGSRGFSGDGGLATSAQLNGPGGVAVDAVGNLYIADNARIRKVSGGVITTVAGNGGSVELGENGAATSALMFPAGVAVDFAGNFYVADGYYNRIRKITAGVITTVAGGGRTVGDNGPARGAQVHPAGIAVNAAGRLFIADATEHRIRSVADGVIGTVAGVQTGGGTFGIFSGDGPLSGADFGGPHDIAVDAADNLYIADFYRIRKISGGVITTVAGNGRLGYSGDNGPATRAELGASRIAVDAAGDIYLADPGNDRIRKVSNGVITTVVGGGATLGDDGPATSAKLLNPTDVTVDSFGNLYIVDTGHQRIRRVSNGVITTVAGGGFRVGDNIPATTARLVLPTSIAVDGAGNLYIADNGRILKVSGGVISTVAGGGSTWGDNGPATQAELSSFSSLAVDAAGKVYLTDGLNSRVRVLAVR